MTVATIMDRRKLNSIELFFELQGQFIAAMHTIR